MELTAIEPEQCSHADYSKENKIQPKVPASEDETLYPHGIQLFINFLSITLATILCGYVCRDEQAIHFDTTLLLISRQDTNCITTIIPIVTDTFQSLSDVGWYGAAFLLASASSQLFYGKIYCLWSAKHVFSAAIFIFAFGSFLCAIAMNSICFIVGRAFSGLASAGVLAGTNIIISRCVPVRQRPIYSSIIGAIECIAISAGPLLGGAITDSLGWRWCFWIMLPLAAASIGITIFSVDAVQSPEQSIMTPKSKLAQLDFSSMVLFIPCVMSLILALQWGGVQYPWSNWRIIILLGVSGFLFIAFAVLQYWKGDDATVPSSIFLSRTVFFGALYSFNTSGALFIADYYVRGLHLCYISQMLTFYSFQFGFR